MSNDTGLVFIHIPKTGGTSVMHAIAEHRLPFRVASHDYPAPTGAEEVVVLRDPFARFVSAFRYGKTRWPNAVNARFDSAGTLAEAAGDPAHPHHASAWTELGNRPADFLARNGAPTPTHTVLGRPTALCWVYEPQSSWLVHSPKHRLRQHRLDADFDALLRAHGLPPVVLPRLNPSAAVGPDQLSAAARVFLAHLYAADVEAVGALDQGVPA